MAVLRQGFEANKSINNQATRSFARDGLDYEIEYLLSGYFFTSFKLPSAVFTIGDGVKISNVESSQTVLNALCTKYDLPDVSINQVTVDGLGGMWTSIPGRMDIGKTFNVGFVETGNADILGIMNQWLGSIRDFRTGVANIGNRGSGPQGTSSNYVQPKYKGQSWFFATDPSMDRVIIACENLGIWPTNLPLSSYQNDIASNEKVEVSITMSHDRMFMYPAVVTKCMEFLNERYSIIQEIEKDEGIGDANIG